MEKQKELIITGVLVKQSGAVHVVHIMNKLEELQKLVGGHIEPVSFPHDIVAIVDEEGALKEKKRNAIFTQYAGDIAFFGEDGEEFVSLKLRQFAELYGMITEAV